MLNISLFQFHTWRFTEKVFKFLVCCVCNPETINVRTMASANQQRLKHLTCGNKKNHRCLSHKPEKRYKGPFTLCNSVCDNVNVFLTQVIGSTATYGSVHTDTRVGYFCDINLNGEMVIFLRWRTVWMDYCVKININKSHGHIHKTRMHSSRMHTSRSLPHRGLPDKDSIWTETPLDRDPPPLDRDPLDTPWTERHLWNITLPQTSFSGGKDA